MDVLLDWLVNNRTLLVIVVVLLLALVILRRMLGMMWRLFRSVRRRGRPVELHPKLQPYAGHSDAELQREREQATGIVATSSTQAIAGYDIVRQIEAVFVEGYRSPQEASTALKAAAARQGANALVNLAHQRTVAGKCSASGDAVVITPRVDRNPPANPL